MNGDVIASTLFCDQMSDDELSLEIKKIEIASAMSALLVFSKKNSAYMAKKLNKTPSQISKTLSGEQNLTIKTILEYSLTLGYDFDVVFHSKEYSKPKQPWHHEQDRILFLNLLKKMKHSLEMVNTDIKDKRNLYSKNIDNANIDKYSKYFENNHFFASQRLNSLVFNLK